MRAQPSIRKADVHYQRLKGLCAADEAMSEGVETTPSGKPQPHHPSGLTTIDIPLNARRFRTCFVYLSFTTFSLSSFRCIPFPSCLVVDRHRDIRLGMARIFAPPERGDSLVLSPEFQSPMITRQRPLNQRKRKDSQLAIQRMSTQHGPLVSGPRECGNGDGNGNVDANLAGFDVAFKVAGCGAVVGEDGGTVSVYAVVRISGGYEDGEEGRTFVTVDEVDGFLQRLDVDPSQNRPKDFDPVPR
jgi:hypothetical protein